MEEQIININLSYPKDENNIKNIGSDSYRWILYFPTPVSVSLYLWLYIYIQYEQMHFYRHDIKHFDNG